MRTLFFFALIIFCAKSNDALCQNSCLSYKQLTTLLKADLEYQDNFLGSRGFKVTQYTGYSGIGTEWHNPELDHWLRIGKDESNYSPQYIQYRVKESEECYSRLKNILSINNFAKDYERSTNGGHLYFFYSSDEYGIVLEKWRPSSNRNYGQKPMYIVSVHTLRSYEQTKAESQKFAEMESKYAPK